MQPSSPWMSMCIYCISVYALNPDCFEPLMAFLYALIAMDLLLHLFICQFNYAHFYQSHFGQNCECCWMLTLIRVSSVSVYINVWDLSLHNSTFFPVSMMHQQSATPHYSSAQAGGQHYQGQQTMGMMGQGSQGNSMMSQRPMGSYRSSQQGMW